MKLARPHPSGKVGVATKPDGRLVCGGRSVKYHAKEPRVLREFVRVSFLQGK